MFNKKFAIALFSIFFISSSAFSEVTMDRLANATSEPQNWLTHHKTLDGARFVDLDQINKFIVKKILMILPKHNIYIGYFVFSFNWNK